MNYSCYIVGWYYNDKNEKEPFFGYVDQNCTHVVSHRPCSNKKFEIITNIGRSNDVVVFWDTIIPASCK